MRFCIFLCKRSSDTRGPVRAGFAGYFILHFFWGYVDVAHTRESVVAGFAGYLSQSGRGSMASPLSTRILFSAKKSWRLASSSRYSLLSITPHFSENWCVLYIYIYIYISTLHAKIGVCIIYIYMYVHIHTHTHILYIYIPCIYIR